MTNIKNNSEKTHKNEANNQNPDKGFKFFQVTREIIELKDLSLVDMCLLGIIDSLSNNKQGGCFASNDYLSTVLHVHTNTIKNGLTRLKKMGLLESNNQRGTARVLRINKSPFQFMDKLETFTGQHKKLYGANNKKTVANNRKQKNKRTNTKPAKQMENSTEIVPFSEDQQLENSTIIDQFHKENSTKFVQFGQENGTKNVHYNKEIDNKEDYYKKEMANNGNYVPVGEQTEVPNVTSVLSISINGKTKEKERDKENSPLYSFIKDKLIEYDDLDPDSIFMNLTSYLPIDGEKISLEYFRLSVNTFFEDYYDDLQPRDEETDLDDTVSIFLEAYKNRVIED